MAQLARNYHSDLQQDNLQLTDNPEEYSWRLTHALNEIPQTQKLQDPELSELNWKVKETHVKKAIHLSKNNSATSLDGCPYKLWKTLKTQHESATKHNRKSFNITKVLTTLFQDIQTHGVDHRTEFSIGWMCPIFKKKDPSDISNYCPITLLNTDYKLLTKVLALQLMDAAETMVHPDQAGFIPKRSIFNQIRLAKEIINFTEATEANGTIIISSTYHHHPPSGCPHLLSCRGMQSWTAGRHA
jgi:Reverse transcriptase (RNA-dependent DNA polymerase)